MKRAQPPGSQRVLMLTCGVADVPFEAEPGPCLGCRPDHHPITSRLGDHGGRGDSCGLGIAIDHGLVAWRGMGQAKSIDHADIGPGIDCGQTFRKQAQIGLVQTVAIDRRRTRGANDDLLGVAQNRRCKVGTSRSRQTLGIVETRKVAPRRAGQVLEVQRNRRGDERACQAAASCFIRPGDDPDIESTVEPEERGGATLAPFRCARAGRHATARTEDGLALLLADAGFLADLAPQVVQLRPADVTLGHPLDALDLW